MSKKVYLPRPGAGEEPEIFAAVNGRSWRIRKGAEVEVPDELAEVLENARAADTAMEDFLRASGDRTVEL